MQMKKLNLFKTINIIVFFICATSMAANCVNTNILNDQKVISSINNDVFEYQCAENEFSITKNNELVGKIPFDGDVHFKTSRPFMLCNATVYGAKIIYVGVKAQRSGGSFGEAAAAELKNMASAVGAGATGIAAACVELPGGAAVSATLGGAGEVAAAAAAADAALATGGTTAVVSSVIVPVLVGAGVGALIA